MGNNSGACFQRHRGSLPFPCHLQLGTHATINMTTSTRKNSEKGEVSYSVEGSTCKLMLATAIDNFGHCPVLAFAIDDSIISSDGEKLSFQIFKKKTGPCLFDSLSVWFRNPIPWTKTKENVRAWDDVTDTKVYLYGTPNRCGLLVLECEKTDYYSHRCKELMGKQQQTIYQRMQRI